MYFVILIVTALVCRSYVK